MRQVSSGKGGGNQTLGVIMYIDTNDNTLQIVTSRHIGLSNVLFTF